MEAASFKHMFKDIETMQHFGLIHDITPDDAVKLLQEYRQGSYIVRKSSTVNGITITVKKFGPHATSDDGIRHWRFLQTRNGKWKSEGRDDVFDNIIDILGSYEHLAMVIPVYRKKVSS